MFTSVLVLEVAYGALKASNQSFAGGVCTLGLAKDTRDKRVRRPREARK